METEVKEYNEEYNQLTLVIPDENDTLGQIVVKSLQNIYNVESALYTISRIECFKNNYYNYVLRIIVIYKKSADINQIFIDALTIINNHLDHFKKNLNYF